MKYTFNEVKIKGRRSWIENGKRKTQTRTFSQTINPWNRNADGSVKTRQEIDRELRVERDAWASAPVLPNTDGQTQPPKN